MFENSLAYYQEISKSLVEITYDDGRVKISSNKLLTSHMNCLRQKLAFKPLTGTPEHGQILVYDECDYYGFDVAIFVNALVDDLKTEGYKVRINRPITDNDSLF